MQATGRGRELVRWSVFAGDNSELGLLKRGTVELAGWLALQEYDTVASMMDQMNFDAKGTVLEGFQLRWRLVLSSDLHRYRSPVLSIQ